MSRKVTNEIINIIKRDYILIGCYELAKTLNLDPKTIYRYAKKMNLSGPTRKFTADYIIKKCEACNKEFEVSKKCISDKHPAKFCSKVCVGAAKRLSNTKLNRVMQLVNNGLKNREISQLTGFPMGTIASILNRAKYRRGTEGKSIAHLRKKFLKDKCCEICGFDRIVEAAHILAASKGGTYEEFNLLALCPNHHHLFDHNRLTEDEYSKIKNKVKVIKNV